MEEYKGEITEPLPIGGVQQGNYSEFSTEGFFRAYGKAVAYRDEYPSHPFVTPARRYSPDEEEHDIAGIERSVLCFAGTGLNTEQVSSSFEIPHDYAYYPDLGVYLPIESHAHFRPTTAGTGDIKLILDWEYSAPQGAPAAGGTEFFVVSVDDQQYYNLIESFTTDMFDGKAFNPELGGKLGFSLSRDPTDAADTYGADVILEQVALHVPVNDAGSKEPYEK